VRAGATALEGEGEGGVRELQLGARMADVVSVAQSSNEMAEEAYMASLLVALKMARTWDVKTGEPMAPELGEVEVSQLVELWAVG